MTDEPAAPAADDRADVVERCPARAALAGNPSDGYGGAVLAIPVNGVGATCTITRSDRFELRDGRAAPLVVPRWAELRDLVDDAQADGAHALVLATLAIASELVGPPPPVTIEIDTTIPRAVGLAGSSAIVIATLRAVLRIAGHAPLGPDEVAAHALRAETDRLGIAAGLQDRVVQAHGRPMMMRFGPAHARTVAGQAAGTYEPVDEADALRLVVAHRDGVAEPSQLVHAPLRQRFDARDGDVDDAMVALAAAAERAVAALRTNDLTGLGAAIDATFDLRRSMLALDSWHVEMIDMARSAGGHANYTGSGGAVVVLCPDAAVERGVRDALAAIGCRFVARHADAP